MYFLVAYPYHQKIQNTLNADAFDEIENELNCLMNADKCHIALVDFNSKTCILSEYTILDHVTLQLLI